MRLERGLNSLLGLLIKGFLRNLVGRGRGFVGGLGVEHERGMVVVAN